MDAHTLATECVVVGGGPAGLMLGLLLARAGVDTVVLEKHADFLRDFRGDTIHPSTQENLAELGLLDEFLRLPHADMPQVTLSYRGREIVLADFSRLPTRRRAIAFLPQWDFLDLLADTAERLPGFRLLRRTRADGLILDGERVAGVRAVGPDGPVEVRARLVIAADGRDSILRDTSGLTPRGKASPIDVLWFRLPKAPGERLPFIQTGAGTLIAIDRGDFFQVAHLIASGAWEATEHSLQAMRERVARLTPAFAGRLDALGVGDIALLRVRLERLRRWHRDGLLFIGDAAHAMSPAGGVGINLAIQDAVATANVLAPLLRRGRPTERALHRVQRRRALPAMLTQLVQRALQGTLLADVEDRGDTRMPLPLRALGAIPLLRHITGRIVGVGFRPEHVRFPGSGQHAAGADPNDRARQDAGGSAA